MCIFEKVKRLCSCSVLQCFILKFLEISINFKCCYFQIQVYTPDFISMLSRNEETALRAYKRHYKYGRVGDLIYDPAQPLSVKRYPEIVARNDENDGYIMYDNTYNEWVPFDPDHVPWTFTYAPAPRNAMMELDYFLRSVGLVKHKFIWVENAHRGIHRDIFTMIVNSTNRAFLGRFTVAPIMPSIFQHAEMTRNGFIEQDQSDFERFRS